MKDAAEKERFAQKKKKRGEGSALQVRVALQVTKNNLESAKSLLFQDFTECSPSSCLIWRAPPLHASFTNPRE
jgi:hypothetical protein